MRGRSWRCGLWLPLTLTLSPRAGRGNKEAQSLENRPLSMIAVGLEIPTKAKLFEEPPHECTDRRQSRHRRRYAADDQPQSLGFRRGGQSAVQAGSGRLVRRLAHRVSASTQVAGRRRHGHVAQPGEAAQLRSRALRSLGRRPRRGPDLHLLGQEGRRRPHQQLGRSRRDEGDAVEALRRRHGRTHHVRRALLHGAHRLAHRRHRRHGDH